MAADRAAAMSVSKFDFESGKGRADNFPGLGCQFAEDNGTVCQDETEGVFRGGLWRNEKQERNGVTYLPWHAIQDYSWVE